MYEEGCLQLNININVKKSLNYVDHCHGEINTTEEHIKKLIQHSHFSEYIRLAFYDTINLVQSN